LELDNEFVKRINGLIDRVKHSMHKDINYNDIYLICSKLIALSKKCNYFSRNFFDDIQTKTSKEKSLKIALQFFKSIDREFYKKASNIINGKDDKYSLIIHEIPKGIPNTIKKEEEYQSKVGHEKGMVSVWLKGDIRDVYTIVHEIAHTFDFNNKYDKARTTCSDVLPECFEGMLDVFLTNKIPQNDLNKIELERYLKTIMYAFEYNVKYNFYDMKEKNGPLSAQMIRKVLRRYNTKPNNTFGFLYIDNQDINVPLRYVYAGIGADQFKKQFIKNSSKSVERLKKYIELIKENKSEEALKALGINLDPQLYKQSAQNFINFYEQNDIDGMER